MNITALGANHGKVTGSSYLLTSSSGQSILIDLGMYQGSPELEKLNRLPLDCDCSSLLGVVLTHAHLDHCGRLPILLHQGFTKNIWMTPPTRDLSELVLLDSAHIASEDKLHPPIYTKDDVLKLFSLVKTVEYETPLEIGDFTIVFNDAGHILGSSTIEVVDNSSQDDYKKVVFSGDLGNSPQDIVRPTEVITSADIVVMESTYGDRLHPDLEPINAIQAEINAIENFGGTLLIPAFSLERSQEILHHIGHLKRSGKVKPDTIVYLDGPMAQKATAIYEKYPQYYNQEFSNDFKNGNPMVFEGLIAVQSSRESQQISQDPTSKVIIAGSGMMSGGRILNHAINYLPLTSTRVLIVGFQGLGTIGRQLLEGAKFVEIYERKVEVNASINETQAMSSHADQTGLLKWLSTIRGVKRVILTHGEDLPRQTLAEEITARFGITDIQMP